MVRKRSTQTLAPTTRTLNTLSIGWETQPLVPMTRNRCRRRHQLYGRHLGGISDDTLKIGSTAKSKLATYPLEVAPGTQRASAQPDLLVLGAGSGKPEKLGTNWPQMSNLPALNLPIVTGMPDGPWSLEFAANYRLYGDSVFDRDYATVGRYQAKTIPGPTFRHADGTTFTAPAATYYERFH